jgi:hypothetical protein
MRPEDELPHAERGRARGAVARRGEEEELPLADAEAGEPAIQSTRSPRRPPGWTSVTLRPTAPL